MTPTEARLRMINNGFNITPLRDGKRPFLLSWQEHQATESDIHEWEREYPNASNTGIICGAVAEVDIDVLHQAAADALEAWVRPHLGEGKVLVRYGLAPK